MGSAEVNDYLTYLAIERKVAASTQNQALSALLFLFQRILEQEIKLDAVRTCGKGQSSQSIDHS